jgi:hypothetical protein
MATLEGVTLTLLMGPVAVLPVPKEVVDAVQSVQVTTAVGQRSGFQISFTYSKRSMIATTLLPAGFFDPLMRVIVVATLNGIPRVLADGPIKRQDVVASGRPGESRLTITGEDVSAYMNLVDLSGRPFPAMPPFARVALMMASYAMFGVVPLPIPSIFQGPDSPTDKIPQQKGTDFAYADALAKDAGYEFYVTAGPAPGMNTAYWGPQVRVGLPQPALTIDMDHASNVDSLSFSVDGNASELVIGFVKVANVSVPVPVPNVSLLKPPLAVRPVVPTHMKLLDTEKKKLPDALMRLLAGATAADPVTASGSLDVTRYGRPLSARSLVGVRGGGLAHDGLWFVRSVTDNIGRGSWKQSFQLSRDGLVANVPAVPV